MGRPISAQMRTRSLFPQKSQLKIHGLLFGSYLWESFPIMPIRVTCSCGYSTNAPDEMAGKSGRCPKCKATLKIPGSKPAPSATPASTGKPTTQQSTKAPRQSPAEQPAVARSAQGAPAGALDSLYADVGLIQNKGPVCPSCTAPVVPIASCA